MKQRVHLTMRPASSLNYFQNKQNPPIPGVNPNNPQYAHYYKPKGKPWGQIFVYSIALIGVAGFVAYELFWPENTFPTSVAKILRRALWAESEKENHNYSKALEIYKEALEECEKLELDVISDEYTGIQIKAGEMCEKLGRFDEAIDYYYDISLNYHKYLQARVHEISTEETRHIVQKDLRIVVKIAELSKDHVSFLTSLLTIHLDLATHEIVKRLIQRGTPYTNLVSPIMEPKSHKLAISPEGNIVDPLLEVDKEIFEPFRDEYFNARDLLSALYLMTKGPAWTSSYKAQTLTWMILAQCPIGDTLLNMCNLASLYYLTSESLEGEEFRQTKKLNELTPENFPSQFIDLSYEEYTKQLKDQALEHALKKDQFISKSLAMYLKAIEFCKKIPPQQKSQEVEEATVLATYGAGVVNLHMGKYDEAELFLKEAILRAKGSGNEYEQKELERELNKLKIERERVLNGEPSNQELKLQKGGDTFVDIQFDKN